MKQFLIGVAFFFMVFLVWGAFYYAALTTENGVALILSNAPLWSVLVGIPTIFLGVFQFLRNWHKKNIAENYIPELDSQRYTDAREILSDSDLEEIEKITTPTTAADIEHIQAVGEIEELTEADVEQGR